MPQSENLSRYVLHGALAALCAAFIGGTLFTFVSYSTFENTAFVYAALVYPSAFFIMSIVVIPMMLLRHLLNEPYYFIMLLVLGFFSSMLVVNFIMGNSFFSAAAWESWIVVSFGVSSLIFTLAAWAYLHFSEAKWYQPRN